MDRVEGRVEIETQQLVEDIQIDLAQRLSFSNPSIIDDAIERVTLCKV